MSKEDARESGCVLCLHIHTRGLEVNVQSGALGACPEMIASARHTRADPGRGFRTSTHLIHTRYSP